MSHFVVLVLVPGDTPAEEIEGEVERLLAPYDENGGGVPPSYWDWWTIGGRWAGMLSGNTYSGNDYREMRAHADAMPLRENTCRVRDLPSDPDAWWCYAIVTPDGEWHSKGTMGWWAMSFDEKPPDRWEAEKAEVLSGYPDHIAVCVDAHV